MIAEKRIEVTRLATLAEVGAETGTLNEVVAGMIEKADADELVKLQTYYRGKVAAKFPDGKSSLENSEEIETAGGVKTETKQTKTVNVRGLHD